MRFERVIHQIVSTRRDNSDEILNFELGLEMTLKPEVQDFFYIAITREASIIETSNVTQMYLRTLSHEISSHFEFQVHTSGSDRKFLNFS